MRIYIICAVLVLSMMTAMTVQATHLRTADVTVEQVCGSPRTYRITVTAYLNTLSTTRFGGSSLTDGHVRFGDGTLVLIPDMAATPRLDLGPQIGVAKFVVTHTYQFNGIYTITYFERDRSGGVLNMNNAGDTPYVSSVVLNADTRWACNKFAKLQVAPVDRACLGTAFSHSPGAVDEDGDSLSYELTVPLADANIPVSGYFSPDAPKFYIDHSKGNEDGDGPPVFSIDPETGLVTWNAPGMVGEYNIAFKIIEWKDDPVTGEPVMMSSITRDMQIIVEECLNLRPEFSLFPADLCVEAGTPIHVLIKGTDPEQRNVKIEVISEVLDLPADKKPATYSPAPPVFRPSDPPAELSFSWNTDCLHVRQQPYQVVVKITDDPPHATSLVTFRTLTIRVIAPAPVWKSHGLDLVHRWADLEWEDYSCTNASRIQVWRKVGSYPFNPGLCDTGLPRFSGYQLAGEVDASETHFTDTNHGQQLVVGAQYHYRLVAVFDAPSGAKSKASAEVVIGPIEADAPVITHVSIEKTATDGEVRVSWRSPFNISKEQFPGPYRYDIYRANDFAGNGGIVKAGEATDTTFVDKHVDTDDQIFNYRIVLYSRTQNDPQIIPVDTSAAASTVRLSSTPGVGKIELMWRDSVPWSNVAQINPRHLIYRGESEQMLKLIDSVDVSENGASYTDNTVDINSFYFYKIVTRGSYGNPAIELQENSSQIISLYPVNDLLPCAPAVSIARTDCHVFHTITPCGQQEFTNSLSWVPSLTEGCRIDITGYNVYAMDEKGEYQQIASHVNDIRFEDTNLPSFARCYRVTAVDSEGNESPMSDSLCNDNCPYFELPNILTPNNDGCNDRVSTFYTSETSVQSQCASGDAPVILCSRFVQAVRFKVYNRWGKEVYSFRSDSGNPVTIDWNGKDKNGTLLDAAIYYYIADVSFDVMDPSRQNGKIKGWISLIY